MPGVRKKKALPQIQFSPDHDFRSKWKVCEQLHMTREDAAAFSDSLRSAFPRLHLVSHEYWNSFLDWDWWRSARQENERREKAGLPTQPSRHRMRDPGGDPPRYWDSLAVVDEREFYGWILPEGWSPEWGEADQFGIRRIVNTPRLEFSFRRSVFYCADRDGRRETVRFDDPPEPRTEDETIRLEGGDLAISWNRYDEEAEAFAKIVFRLLFKQTTDRFIQMESKSRRALSPVPWNNRRYGMAGRHAEAWALARRHNYLFDGRLNKPASYSFAPGDVFSADELAAIKAKWAAELEEIVAREKRKDKELAEKWRREAEGA